MASIGSKGLLGAVLMVVGVAGFLPTLTLGNAQVFKYLLVPAVLLLALGTLIVGTESISGRPV